MSRNDQQSEAAWDLSDKAKQEARDGNFAAAQSDIARAIGLDPKEPDFHNTLAAILLEKDPNRARAEARKAIDLSDHAKYTLSSEQKAAAYVNLADLDINLKDYGAAVEDGMKATALNPKDAHAWNNLGVAYLRMHKNKEAVDALQRSVQLNPTSEHAQRNLNDAKNAER